MSEISETGRGVKRVRDQDSDPILDRHGNPSSARLFVDRLPYDITEREISELFNKYEGFTNIQMGNKALKAGEFRTCVVIFASSEQSAAARITLQHFQGPGWTSPMLINFVKQDPRDHQYPPHALAAATAAAYNSEMVHDRDSLGNMSCATLFVKNFVPSITSEKIRELFPTAVKILAGTKELKPGEYRTGYITFEDMPAAVAARHHMNGFTDNEQTIPLIINYSVRPQDQPRLLPYSMHPMLGFPPFGSPYPGFDMGFNSASRYAQQHHHHHHHHQQQQAAAAAYANAAMFTHSGLFDTGSQQAGFADFHRPPSPISSGASQMVSGLTGLEGAQPGFSVGDLYDTKGHPASPTLFVDCLPYDIQEYTVHGIFCTTLGFKYVIMGTKALQTNEYRTAQVHYTSVEHAVRARGKLQYHREYGWLRPLIINYAKH